MVDKCPAELLASRDVVIEVTCKIEPKKNELTHTFRVSAKERV
jgi:hypothetical protein